VTDLLRSHYAAPQDETYWNSLEARVMLSVTRGLGRISDLRPAWWSGFGEFRTADIRNAGLIAATIASRVRVRLPEDAPERYLHPLDY
jgi:hypothetical protein